MPTSSTQRSSLTSTARSLADDIRGRSDESLRALLRLRPDLARPAPSDLTSLAARASTRASVQRAVDGLDRAHLQVLEGAALTSGPVDRKALAVLLGAARAETARLGEILDDLYAAALVWGTGDAVQVTRTVLEVLGSHVAGLGPSVVDVRGSASPAVLGADAIAVLLDQAPIPARAILDRLAWGPPLAILDAQGRGASGEGARWLLEHHLVLSTAADTVLLPREVALALRGGHVHRSLELTPPPVGGAVLDPAEVDRAAGGEASGLLLLVDELGAEWGQRPPRVLRAGGLAVRDLKRLAQVLDIDTTQAAFVAEAALAAGLIGDDGALEPVWAPTPTFDEWQASPDAARWATLATAWLASTRSSHLVGSTPAGVASAVNALGPEATWPPARALRRDLLALLATLDPGHAPSSAELTEALRWRRPQRVPAGFEAVAGAILREARWLGITGRDALSSGGRALAAEPDPTAAARVMRPHLPEPVHHVLLQADLTAVAPGPLEPSLAAFMRLVAEVESRGGATVYRFGAASLRRALDVGWTADQVLNRLSDGSPTPVPQPLDYLVRDVARRHGQARVGAATSYVRSDDEASLGAMLADRTLGALQLRRIAPTVLVSPVSTSMMLEFLRENGFSPVAEAADGVVVVASAGQHRTPARRPGSPVLRQTLDDEAVDLLIASLRTAEEAADLARSSATGPRLESTDPTTALAMLREAVADGTGVWLGYTNHDGAVTRMLFHPDRVESGRIHGTADGGTRTLSVHRITGASHA